MEKSPFPFPFVCSTKIVYGAVDGELQVASVPLLSAKVPFMEPSYNHSTVGNTTTMF